jgi:hypothetical protein
MGKFDCPHCPKNFNYKHHLENHLNKKIPCYLNIAKNNKEHENILHNNKIKVDSKILKEHLDECRCVYCGKEFARKDCVMKHIENSCKKVKEIEYEKHIIFTKLKELEENNKKLTEENKKLYTVVENLEKKIDNKKITSINNNTIHDNNINSHNTDNSINQQNIILNNYKKEDMSKIDESVILAIMKRGFQTAVELTREVHFNPKYPEYHNIFIPKINERYGMVFMNNCWKITDRDELVNDIYENKRAFVIGKKDTFYQKLNEFEKTRLNRWLDNDDNEDEAIINTKNDIKKLLYDNRHMAIDRKNELEKQNRKQILQNANKKKPLEIVELKKKKYDSNKELDNDSSSDSDSSYISNYSYVHSSEKDNEKE